MGRRSGPNQSAWVGERQSHGARPGIERGRAWRIVPTLHGALVLLLCTVAAGCHSGPKNFENENDSLRTQVLDLQDQVTGLEAELGESKAKINELQSVLAGTGDAPAREVLEALPRCSGIEIERLSGPIDKDGEPGYPESIEVYIRPFDGRQRFVQVVGTLTVEARYLPASATQGADDRSLEAGVRSSSGGDGGVAGGGVLLGAATLGPSELREAYRSGFTGTHYTVRLTPPGNVWVLDGAIVISVVLLDRVSGLRHEAWRVVRVAD